MQQEMGNKKPFGGLAVIVSGDFHQLPPVKGGNRGCTYKRAAMTEDQIAQDFQKALDSQCDSDDNKVSGSVRFPDTT